MSAYTRTTQAKIASGETVGVAADLRGQRLVGIKTPADLTGVTLTWQVGEASDATFYPAYHLSTLAATATVLTSIADDRFVVIPADKAPANCWLKLVSGSAEGADRVFTLFTEAL